MFKNKTTTKIQLNQLISRHILRVKTTRFNGILKRPRELVEHLEAICLTVINTIRFTETNCKMYTKHGTIFITVLISYSLTKEFQPKKLG